MTFPSSKSLLYNTSLPSFNVDKEKTKNNLNLTTITKPESINHQLSPSSTSTLPSPSSPTVPLHVNKNLPLRKRLTKDHHQQQQQLLQHNFQFKSITTSTSSIPSSSIPSSSISPTSSVMPLQWQPIETVNSSSSSSSSLQSKKETILLNNNNNEMKKIHSSTTTSSSSVNNHHNKSSMYSLPPLKPLSPNENNIIKSTHSIQSKHNNLIASSSPIKTNFIPTIIDSSSDFISLNKKSNNTNNNKHTTPNNNDNNKKKILQAKRKQMSNDENKHIKKAKRGRPPLNNNTSVSKSSSPRNNNETSLLSPNHILKNNNINTLPLSKSTTQDLYCICQKPYDTPRFMIACDRCDQWFHGECIGISEKEGEFVDLYFCESCSALTGKKTSWKAKCFNTTCEKASRISKNQGHLSKYCSDHCGMQVARARLAMAEKEEEEKERGKDDNNNRIDENNNNDNNEKIIFKKKLEDLSKARLSLFADRDDRLRLRKIKQEKQNAITIIHLINKKYDFLQGLMKQQDESSPDNNNNNNNKQQDEICGFDSRLMWSDDQWDLVESIQQEPLFKLVMKKKEESQEEENQGNWSICQKSKKKCQRHNGWMKLKSLEFEQEREEQFVILSVLARERKQIKTRISNRLNEMNLVNSLMNGTLVHNQ